MTNSDINRYGNSDDSAASEKAETSRPGGGFFGSPIIWGILMAVAFYTVLHSGVIRSEFMMRYFAGHQISYTETGMFFVGFAALVMRWRYVRSQRKWMNTQLSADGQRFLSKSSGFFSCQDAGILLGKIRKLSPAVRDGYFVGRLENTLDFVHRNQSSVGIEDEMKYLSDMDTERMTQGYSLVKLTVWAIPILGFLGTVMGITVAIGSLGGNLADTAAALPKMIAGLGIAFDTTAIALCFSLVLMFIMYLLEKQENQLLSDVDRQVHLELSGRFDPIPDTQEGAVLAIRRVGDVVLAGMKKHAETQSAVWEESFRHVEKEWTRRLETLGQTLASALHAALAQGGAQMGEEISGRLTKLMENAGAKMGETVAVRIQKELTGHFEKSVASQAASIKEVSGLMAEQGRVVREAVTRNVENTARNAEVISKSGEILYHAGNQMEKTATALTDATQMARQVAEMEHVLAENLSTLQGARNFERTVGELSLATRMLTQWLEDVRGMRKAG